jgi:colicin import membrane protein
MSAVLAFDKRREPGLARAFGLATAVHLALLGVMFFGVRLQSHPPESVVVELWDVPPPPVVEAPKPEPKVEQPEPRIVKPDIVEKAVPKPKPKPDDFKKSVQQQLALEQKAMDEQRKQEELRAEQRQVRERLAREQAAARARALAEYIARIQAKVKSNWILPPDLKGNPEAVFLVVQLPTGEVLSVKVVKSSGIPAYDAAVERAILKSSPLPLPVQRELFDRELRLTFRPRD